MHTNSLTSKYMPPKTFKNLYFEKTDLLKTLIFGKPWLGGIKKLAVTIIYCSLRKIRESQGKNSGFRYMNPEGLHLKANKIDSLIYFVIVSFSFLLFLLFVCLSTLKALNLYCIHFSFAKFVTLSRGKTAILRRFSPKFTRGTTFKVNFWHGN